MMNSAILISLLAAVGVTLVTGCCTPDQWEGFQGSVTGYSSHHGTGMIREMKQLSYDYTNKRVASFVTYVNKGHESKFQMVIRYDKEKEGHFYFVDLKTGKCTTKKLDKELRKACIPPKAKFISDYYMGLKGGFKVSGYEFDIKKDMSGFVSVAKQDSGTCIPVTESIYGHYKDVSFLEGIGFSNVTPGISNSSVFDVPKGCKKTDDMTYMVEYLVSKDYKQYVFGL